MKLRDDIDIQNTWITSDSHFGHQNIVGYCSRPDDHDQLMLEQWRAHVPDDATVLHLGDLCWKNNGLFKHTIAPRLTGARKLLILGNHDKSRPSFYRDAGFKIVRPFAIEYGTFKTWWTSDDEPRRMPYIVSFDHYALREGETGLVPGGMDGNVWSMYAERAFRVHGHIHNHGYADAGRDPETGERLPHQLVPFLRNHINVSVEQTRYRPVNLGLLLDAAILGKVPDA